MDGSCRDEAADQRNGPLIGPWNGLEAAGHSVIHGYPGTVLCTHEHLGNPVVLPLVPG